MRKMIELCDHLKKPAQQHRVHVNGVEIHAVTAGTGQPLLLIHGTPKTHIYWCKLLPLLTEKFRVIAPDLRGAGISSHPFAEDGHLSTTVATDLVGLLDALSVENAFVHGEDRGAEYGFVMAGLYPDRVKALSFSEMMLSGFGLEERSFLNDENVLAAAQRRGVWEWHVPFFFKPEVPELLIRGNERAFWTYWMDSQAFDPTTLPKEVCDEWIELLSTPHGLRGTLDTYRATLKNAHINRRLSSNTLITPTMAIGASHFFGGLVAESLTRAGSNVREAHVFEECGHSLAIEKPHLLAAKLQDFFESHG